MRLLVTAGLGAALLGCELPEVTVPPGEPMVAVHAIMRPDLTRQWVLVEWTLTGTVDADETPIAIPGFTPPLPIGGATVTVVNETLQSDPCGVTTFLESAAPPSRSPSDGLYWSPVGCPTMRPGDLVRLEITTPDGTVVTGTTQIVGARDFTLRAGRDSVAMMAGGSLTFNRDTDTLGVEVIDPIGRALQIEVSRPDSLDRLRPGFWFVVDTTSLTFPANLPDIVTGFQDAEELPETLPPVFAAGRYYGLTAAIADDHYYDYVRSGNIPPSGRGYINSIEGGIGVFASLSAVTVPVAVVGTVDDAREGTYRATGWVGGRTVTVDLELYVTESGADSTDASAFVRGLWVMGPINTSADGYFRNDSLALVVYQQVPALRDSAAAVLLVGPSPANGPVELTAYDRDLRVIGIVEVGK